MRMVSDGERWYKKEPTTTKTHLWNLPGRFSLPNTKAIEFVCRSATCPWEASTRADNSLVAGAILVEVDARGASKHNKKQQNACHGFQGSSLNRPEDKIL